MAVGGEDESEKYLNLREVPKKHGSLVVFMRLDPAEIRRLVGRTPLAVSARVGEASPGVFGVFVGYVSSPSRPKKGFLLNQT
jgi:hypothetical protein